jgi:2-polyprenyl-3-methyl-5-hydroxy-6-metoxy-1,4-benzoquinol methylase
MEGKALAQTIAQKVNRCVLCGGSLTVQFSKHGYEIADCDNCRHRQTILGPDHAGRGVHVAEVYGDTYFTDGGAGYVDYLAEGPMLRDRGHKYGEILKRHRSSGTVLDVGAAAGFLMQGMGSLGFKTVGIEPNNTMAEHGRSQLDLDLRTGSLEDAEISESFEIVSMIQVMAHFVDPLAVLEKVRSLTVPGGLLLVETWDRDSRTARTLGHRWHEYSPPSVLHWWGRDELRRVLSRVGYRQLDTGRMTKWIAGHHAKSLLSNGGGAGQKVGRLIPGSLRIPYPSEDLFWALYERSAE